MSRLELLYTNPRRSKHVGGGRRFRVLWGLRMTEANILWERIKGNYEIARDVETRPALGAE